MTGADLDQAYIKSANFKGADLTNANLKRTTQSGARFKGAKWFDGAICQPPSIGKCQKNERAEK